MSNIRLFVRLFLYILVPGLVAFGTYRFMSTAFLEPAEASQQDTKLVEISPGMSFRDVAEKVRADGIVRYAQALRVLARLQGSKQQIAPGEYPLSPSMTPKKVLEVITSGKVHERRLMVTAGLTIWEIAELVGESGLMTKEQFSVALTSPELLARAGIPAPSFEGYLYPSNYSFSRPVGAEKIIWTMLEEGEQHWEPRYSDQAQNLKYGRPEVLTLASIIQKESEYVADYPLLSSVLHNRLTEGLKLKSESTVIYGLRDFSGQLTKEDLETPSVYNTFLNFGLPPGPICNPGKEAIEAALFPEESSYLFFLKTPSGRLEFYTTEREYEDARADYLAGR